MGHLDNLSFSAYDLVSNKLYLPQDNALLNAKYSFTSLLACHISFLS
jgi:ribonucleotide reductase alpha subunit